MSGVTSSIQTQLNASGGLGSAETIANAAGNASLTISSTGNSGPESSLQFVVDDTSGSNQDRSWTIRTEAASHGELVVQTQWLNATKTPIRCLVDGNIGFNSTSTSNHFAAFGGTVLLKDDVTCWGDLNLSANNKSVDCGTGTVTCGTLALGGSSYTSIPETVMRVDTTTASHTITSETHLVTGNPQSSGVQTPTVNYDLPIGAYRWNGRTIEILGDNYGSGNAVIQMNCVSTSPQETISAGSVGTLSNLQGSVGNQGFLNTRLKAHHGRYTCIFNSSTNRWTIAGTPATGP